MDTTLAAIAILAWTFLFGMLAGISLEQGGRRRSPSTMDRVMDQAIKDVRTVETFAGVPAASKAIVRDHDGSDWRVTIEREKA